MTLTWYGLSSFKIASVGGETTIITDPFSASESGLTAPRGGASIVLISKDNKLHNNIDGITGEPKILRNPGEFDINGVHIRGIYDGGRGDGTIIFHIEVDGVKIGFLGGLVSRELTEQQLEDLNGVDVLLIPVGGKEKVCNWEWASHIVQQIEPRFVVPCFFKQPGLKFDLDSPEKFVKELGNEPQNLERLTLKPKDVAGDITQVVLLSPQR